VGKDRRDKGVEKFPSMCDMVWHTGVTVIGVTRVAWRAHLWQGVGRMLLPGLHSTICACCLQDNWLLPAAPTASGGAASLSKKQQPLDAVGCMAQSLAVSCAASYCMVTRSL
jgi:hypothetical protein